MSKMTAFLIRMKPDQRDQERPMTEALPFAPNVRGGTFVSLEDHLATNFQGEDNARNLLSLWKIKNFYSKKAILRRSRRPFCLFPTQSVGLVRIDCF